MEKFNSILQKKKRSSKGSSQPEPYSSPTVIAAATEKYIRKKTTEPTTIQSEDLTCSQFAFMAGIKIKKERYNEEEDDYYYQDDNNHFLDTDNEDEDEDEEDEEDEDENYPFTMDDRHMTILKSTQNGTMPTPPSIMTSYSTSSRYQHHQIWDARFWQNKQQNKPTKSKSCHSILTNNNTNNETHKNDQSSHYSIHSNDTISSSSSTNSSSCSSSTSNLKKNQSPPKIIQKGRFQIVVGDHLDKQQFYQGEPLVKTSSLDSSVVEWRRKRALST
ncbi:unnamed protein product [Cunninghamella blakesleeana]